jgi:predicted DsbA family dithiol-disulfide isomerase
MDKLEIQITQDFICPWCWIGEQKLKNALVAEDAASKVRLIFMPYELNPGMAKDGMDRKQYRSTKFGSWSRSQAMDAHVTEAGRAEGLSFNYDVVTRTPNTLAAHRLVWMVQKGGGDATALVHAIFKAYFTEGRDIGDTNVLTEIAVSVGESEKKARRLFSSNEGVAEVRVLETVAAATGVSSVPSVKVDLDVVSGAQPVQVFRDALRSALEDDAKLS